MISKTASCVLCCFVGCLLMPAWAACPPADLTGDGAILAGEWRPESAVADDMVLIPAGTFLMGDSFGEGSQANNFVHVVSLSSFYMSKYETTNGQYCEFLNWAWSQGLIAVSNGVVHTLQTNYPYCDTSASTDSQINYSDGVFSVRTKGGRDMSNDPMTQVSWYGAAAYCNWRSEQEGLAPCYDLSTWDCDFTKNGYRLPTEAQWEYAARGGLYGKRFPWGDTITHSQANYWSSSSFGYDVSPSRGYHPTWNDGIEPYTSPVGSFAHNGYGLYDMAGNVSEWCNDWYGSLYYWGSPPNDPTGPATGSGRVLRGGNWINNAYSCRVAHRDYLGPVYRSGNIRCGFRVSRTVVCPKADLTGDCSVGFADAAVMADEWLTDHTPDDMVLISAGTFQMGDSFGEGWVNELPVHTVTLSPFYMSKYETTNGEYCEFLNWALSQGLITVSSGIVYKAGSGTSYPYCATSGPTRSQISYSGGRFTASWDVSNYPMVGVSWYGAAAYCNWRSQKEGLQPCYDLSTWECDFRNNGYHLPTEAQWEYAARGGLSGKRFPWGDTISHSQANYESTGSWSYDAGPTLGYHPTWNDGIEPYTSPVGSFAPNSYGLYDMAGNVLEWCNDWARIYNFSPQTNPKGPTTGSYRVLRGGGWSLLAFSCRIAYRHIDSADRRNHYNGLRVCRSNLPWPQCPKADLTGDCRVDLADFAIMASEWLTEGPAPDADDGMVVIPAGTFLMGDSFGEGSDAERPVSAVSLSVFYMSKYETTNGQYCEFLNAALSQGLVTVSSGIVYKSDSGASYAYCDTSTSSSNSQINYSDGVFRVRTNGWRHMSNDPMVCVSWYGAAAYCNWRSEQEGLEPCYDLSAWNCDFGKNGYRLPTEAQWEYAARGGLSGMRFPWGNTISHSQANYHSSTGLGYDVSPTRGYHPAWKFGDEPYTSPVGSFSPNGYGLYDMAGNVYEWCNDWYGGYSSTPKTDPTGPASGVARIIRGGSWSSGAPGCRVAERFDGGQPAYRRNHYGFRVCR